MSLSFSIGFADGNSAFTINGKTFPITAATKLIWPRNQKLEHLYDTGEEFPYGRWFLSSFQTKTVPFLPDRVVVLAEITKNTCTTKNGENGTEITEAQFAILHLSGQNLKLESKVAVEASDDPFNWSPGTSKLCTQNFYSHDLSFDFAPYMISKEDRAFGYRVTATSHHANEVSSQTRLFLYHLHPGTKDLVKVLSLPVESTSEIDGKSHGSTSTTISVSKTQKKGANIWTAYEYHEDTDSNGKKSKKLAKKKELVWDGSHYSD